MIYNLGMFTLETSPTAVLPFVREAMKEFLIPAIAKNVTLELLTTVSASCLFYCAFRFSFFSDSYPPPKSYLYPFLVILIPLSPNSSNTRQ